VASKRVGGGRRALKLDRHVGRGTDLGVPRTQLPEPEEDSYYVFQLVGLGVEEEGGRALGRVVDVAPGPANDALELDTGALLPLVEDCIRLVDVVGGRIVVAPGFTDPS
jgi:16S rRNA processing protein RimM